MKTTNHINPGRFFAVGRLFGCDHKKTGKQWMAVQNRTFSGFISHLFFLRSLRHALCFLLVALSLGVPHDLRGETVQFAQTVDASDDFGSDFIGAGYDVHAGIFANVIDNPFFRAEAHANVDVNVFFVPVDVFGADAELQLDTGGLSAYASADWLGQNLFYFGDEKERSNSGSVTNSLSTMQTEMFKKVFNVFSVAFHDDFSQAADAFEAFKTARNCPDEYRNADPFTILSGILIATGQGDQCALFTSWDDVVAATTNPTHVTRVFLDAVGVAYPEIDADGEGLAEMLYDVLRSVENEDRFDIQMPEEPSLAGDVPIFKEKLGFSCDFVIVFVPVTVGAGVSANVGWEYSFVAHHTVEAIPLGDGWNMMRYVACDRSEMFLRPYADLGLYANAFAGIQGLLAVGVNGTATLIQEAIEANAKACLFTHPSFVADISHVTHEPSGKVRLFAEYPTIEVYTQCHRICFWGCWDFCHPWIRFGSAKAYHTICEWLGREHRTVLATFGGQHTSGNPEDAWAPSDSVFEGNADNPRVLSWIRPTVVLEASQIKAVVTYEKPLTYEVRLPVFWEGTAEKGTDFDVDSDWFVIPPGAQSAEIRINLLEDDEYEETEEILFYCYTDDGERDMPEQAVQIENTTQPPVTLTPGSTINGIIVPSDPVVVKHGGSQAFWFYPDPHCHVEDVLVDGVSIGVTNGYTFRNVITNHTLDVVFDINGYVLTPEAGENGIIIPSDPAVVEYGGNQRFIFEPSDGYEVLEVFVDGVSQGEIYEYLFDMVTTNHMVYALFSPIILNEKLKMVDFQSNDRITGTKRWGHSEGTIRSYTFSVGESVPPRTRNSALEVTYKAHSQSASNWEKNGVELRIYKDEVLLAEGDDSYDSESESDTPVPGYDHTQRFYGLDLWPGDEVTLEIEVWTGDYINYISSLTVETFWDRSRESYIIETHAEPGGHIDPFGQIEVLYGSNQLFSIESDESYAIRDVLIDDTSRGALSSYGFTNVASDHTLQADFFWTNAVFHFPQNSLYPFGLISAARDETTAKQAYLDWKKQNITSEGAGGFRRVLWYSDRSTVSEGIGYGLLLAVNYNDKPLFDDLWNYYNLHLDANGLMHWKIDASGQTVGANAATDADQDTAFALVLAHEQWGSVSVIDYLQAARTMLERIFTHEVEAETYILKPGDVWGGSDVLNPSYFRPAYYRMFSAVSGNREWELVLEKSYEVLERIAHPETGLVPDWCRADGSPVSCSAYPGHCGYDYGYEAVRVPFFVALDYLWYGAPEAYDFCTRIVDFFVGVGVDEIVDGYALNGTPLTTWGSPIFIASLAAAAMTRESDSEICDLFYNETVSQSAAAYYTRSWKALSLFLQTGNFHLPDFPILFTKVHEGGFVEPSFGHLLVIPGGNQSFSIYPQFGREIDEVIVDGESIGWTNRYDFLNVTNDHVLEVYFTDVAGNDDVFTNYYVSPMGSHAPPFVSWATAATQIQSAVNLAGGGETVWVTNGTYGTGGGTGPDSTLSSRLVIAKPVTVRSVNGPEHTFILGAPDPVTGHLGTNAVRGVYLTQEALGAALIGFTIANGHTHASTSGQVTIDHVGGGICQQFGTVSNCIIRGNSAQLAGGVFCSYGVLDHCVIRENSAESIGGGIYGDRGKINHCTIRSNSASSGGGIFCWEHNVVQDSIICDNTANEEGGGIWCTYADVIRRSIICENSAASGGGVHCQSSSSIDNCVISENSANKGGGMYCEGGIHRNSTIVRNSAEYGGGAFVDRYGTINNTVLYANSATSNGDNYYNNGSTMQYNYCCATPSLSPGFGADNLFLNPLFVDEHTGNYRLRADSPCINAGNNADAVGSIDLDGHSRIRGICVDMGAYEFLDPEPHWWYTQGVLQTNHPCHDYAAANIGQLKHVASKAREAMDDLLPGGASSNINTLVDGFQNSNNYIAINLGQLKYVAQPFYDRLTPDHTNLWPLGMTVGPYPWSGSTNLPEDYSAGNIGQLKYIFSFDFSAP